MSSDWKRQRSSQAGPLPLHQKPGDGEETAFSEGFGEALGLGLPRHGPRKSHIDKDQLSANPGTGPSSGQRGVCPGVSPPGPARLPRILRALSSQGGRGETSGWRRNKGPQQSSAVRDVRPSWGREVRLWPLGETWEQRWVTAGRPL